MSDRRKSLENKIHELYAISSNREAGFVKNMDDILEFGKEIFGADVGLISHFSGAHRAKILINYATSNDFGIEKDIETPVEECYSPVRGGQIFACSDTSQLGCKNCLHINKNITSMLSAPLKIAGRVEGAITFLTVTPNQMLIMEEDINFMGFIGGLMGMALELRSAKKAVDSGLSTLKKLISSLDVPCVITDTSLRIKNANDIMLRICGAHDIVEVEEKNIFMRFAADDAKAHMRFISAHKSSRGGIFDTDFDIMLANSKTQNIVWHIVEINDGKNSLKGFLFVGESVKDLPAVRGLLADGPSMHA
jgi:PAS domain-containing protein